MSTDTMGFEGATQLSHRRARSNTPPLPRFVQDHLARELRVDYYERSDRPRYLGDPALPLEFEPYLYRLAQKEQATQLVRIREEGTSAVADALSDLLWQERS